MYRENREGGFRSGGFRSIAPVKVGEELEVTIEAVGAKGDGIAKKNGFVLFVPGVKEGQTVRIKVTKVLNKVGFAELAGEGSSTENTEQESGEQQETPTEQQSETSETTQEPQAQDSEEFGEEQN